MLFSSPLSLQPANPNAARFAGILVLGPLLIAPILVGTVAAQKSKALVATQVVVEGAAPATPAPAAASVPTPPGTPNPNATPDGKPGAPPMPGQKAEEKPKVTSRPVKPKAPANPDELKAHPDENGMIRFSFRGQPWPEVIEWLAEVSAMSVDWQELPPDYLNLSVQREYTVAEARDLINRHLLARGFTMLHDGETLTVANVTKLDPGLVPRVEPDELAHRQSHEFVKVNFKLDWLLAEQAVEELKPMLSPNGKMTALKSTNRLEAIDAVLNLRQIWDVLSREQSKDGQERLIKEFVLKFARASEVHQHLIGLLGIEPKSKGPAAPLTPEQQAEAQQQAMMMAQMQQQRGGQPMPPQKKQDNVYLIVNARKNSILANAPPDRMAVIEQAVMTLDVRDDRSESFMANAGRMRVYRLAALDPEPLVKTLVESGNLDPNTHLEVDRKNRAIIADASLIDHATIRMLIDKLDASGRRFEVIPLRRLEADYVAGTVEFMMGGNDKEKPSSNRGYDFFSYYGPRRSSENEAPTDRFRVDADIEFNRLLVWANDIEMEEVENLLVKLGEISPKGGRAERTRTLDALSPEEAAELFERLKKAWPGVAPNQLLIPNLPKPLPATPAKDADHPPPSRARSPNESRPAVEKPKAMEKDMASTTPALSVPPWLSLIDHNSARDLLAVASGEAPESVPTDEPQPPPIRVMIRPDGRLILQSDDTEALDQMEELIGHLAPAKREFKVFTLNHAPAYWVTLNLEDFFEDKEEKKGSSPGRSYYFYDSPPPQKQDSKFRLSKRRPLKFIADSDTNTILVQGADAGQLRTIAELIELYDVPEPADSQATRVSGVFVVKYSKAKVIADAVKDVYRDLLSSNDRALSNSPESQNKPASRTFITNFGGEDDSKKKERTQVSFKGKISIGVDELSNTLVVSTEGESLYRNVSKLIEDLDNAAKPVGNMRVIHLGGNVNPQKVSKALTEMFKKPQPKNPPQPNQPQQVIAQPQPGAGPDDE